MGASDSIIEALARALQLRDDERSHLFDLARPRSAARRRAPRPESAATGAMQLLEAMTGVPAVVLGRRNDVLAWNRLGHALLAGHLPFAAPQEPARRPNVVRMLFLDPHTRELYRDWDNESALVVASLRFVAAHYPDDRVLAELVGELSMKSVEFAALWAKHNVKLCSSGTKHFHHPEVGDIDAHYEALHLPDAEGQRLLTYTAARGTGSADAFRLLGEIVVEAAEPVGGPAPVEPARGGRSAASTGMRST